jgi:hypothetical protein
MKLLIIPCLQSPIEIDYFMSPSHHKEKKNGEYISVFEFNVPFKKTLTEKIEVSGMIRWNTIFFEVISVEFGDLDPSMLGFPKTKPDLVKSIIVQTRKI